jgi:hypothetical protein
MGKEFQINIDSLEVGQILDGLRSRQKSWKNTAIFLRDDFFPDEAFVSEDCSDPNEAKKIADDYRRIISNIEQQVDEQGGW